MVDEKGMVRHTVSTSWMTPEMFRVRWSVPGAPPYYRVYGDTDYVLSLCIGEYLRERRATNDIPFSEGS